MISKQVKLYILQVVLYVIGLKLLDISITQQIGLFVILFGSSITILRLIDVRIKEK